MTIAATHFALVLGAWRLRIRIDIDEPREADLNEERAPMTAPRQAGAESGSPGYAPWGRG